MIVAARHGLKCQAVGGVGYDAQIDRVLDTRILHVGGVGLMNRMDDGSRTREVMAEARRRGVVTTLDVFASTAADLPKVETLLPCTDYFIPSEEEALALSGLHDNHDQAQVLLDRGAGCVILTLGARGAFCRHKDRTEFHTPSFQIEVQCTCGCGDCCNGGFATGLHLGLAPQECVELASAAQNAAGLGRQAGVRDLAHTREFIATTAHRAKV